MKNRIIDILTKPIDHVGRDIILPRREAELIAEKLVKALGEVAYVCDRKACKVCSSEDGFCYHTTDIHHAENFTYIGEGKFAENSGLRFMEDPE